MASLNSGMAWSGWPDWARCQAEIVVSFGEIGIGQDGLMEFFDGVLLIALTPVDQAEP